MQECTKMFRSVRCTQINAPEGSEIPLEDPSPEPDQNWPEHARSAPSAPRVPEHFQGVPEHPRSVPRAATANKPSKSNINPKIASTKSRPSGHLGSLSGANLRKTREGKESLLKNKDFGTRFGAHFLLALLVFFGRFFFGWPKTQEGQVFERCWVA